MKKRICNHEELEALVESAIARTPHASDIHDTVKSIHEYVSEKLDFEIHRVDWFFRQGNPSRSVWVTYNGSTFYFHYDPRSRNILMKENGRGGTPLAEFSGNELDVKIHAKLIERFG
tara:strand:- start:127 stop:477 length:351 start_codon:yes stop_codon:yes gene_type:complete